MNCREFESLLFAVRTPGLDLAVRDHARRCRGCALRLSLETSLKEAQRETAEGMKELGPSAETERKVFEAFGNRGPAGRRGAPPKWWPAAAAAGVLLAALVAVLLQRSVSEPEFRGARPDLSTEFVLEDDASRTAEPGGPEAFDWLPAEGVEADLATDFFVLTNCPDWRCLEGAQQFRVSLPEASIAAFGLPVSGGAGANRIDADVLVGVDGVAHAIRFLRPVLLEPR